MKRWAFSIFGDWSIAGDNNPRFHPKNLLECLDVSLDVRTLYVRTIVRPHWVAGEDYVLVPQMSENIPVRMSPDTQMNEFDHCFVESDGRYWHETLSR